MNKLSKKCPHGMVTSPIDSCGDASAMTVGVSCRLKLSARITIRMPFHLARSIGTAARRAGVTPSDLARQLVCEALNARYGK